MRSLVGKVTYYLPSIWSKAEEPEPQYIDLKLVEDVCAEFLLSNGGPQIISESVLIVVIKQHLKEGQFQSCQQCIEIIHKHLMRNNKLQKGSRQEVNFYRIATYS